MLDMRVVLVKDGTLPWSDLEDRKVVHLGNEARGMEVAVLNNGMETGRPSVALRIDLPDGTVVIVETSARLFCTAAKIIMSKNPDLFVDN